eukprot:8137222-Pyramimonas_sp.AAC.1
MSVKAGVLFKAVLEFETAMLLKEGSLRVAAAINNNTEEGGATGTGRAEAEEAEGGEAEKEAERGEAEGAEEAEKGEEAERDAEE